MSIKIQKGQPVRKILRLPAIAGLMAILCACQPKAETPASAPAEKPAELSITGAEMSPNPFKAGEEVIITFTVAAPDQITAILGSNLSDGTKPYYDFKPEGDQSVILKPGTHDYKVTAQVPDHTPEGNYLLRAAIWRDDHPNGRIDSDFHSETHDTLLWGPKVVRGGLKCEQQ